MLLAGVVAALAITTAAPGTAGAQALDDQDCSNFIYQDDAQRHLNADPSDPDNLDFDDDGFACEDELPQLLASGPQSLFIPTSGPAPAPRPAPLPLTAQQQVPPPVVPIGPDDQDCASFANQDDAQDHLNADLSDPDRLDEDGDGFACESLRRRSGAPGFTGDKDAAVKAKTASTTIPATGNDDVFTYLMVVVAGAALLAGGNFLQAGVRQELFLRRRRGHLTAPPPAD